MRTICTKLFFAAALLIIMGSGTGMSVLAHRSAAECDGLTCATPPVKPTKRDTTQTKKKSSKKSKKQHTKTKKQSTKKISE